MLADLGGILAASAVPLAVTATNETQYNEAPIPCYAGMKIDTDNTIYENNPAGSWIAHDTTYVTGGVPGDVYVERTINSGILDNVDDIGASRVQISTDRILQILDSSDGGGISAANVTVRFYDAATGGNLLDTVVYDLTAVYTTA